MKVSIKGATLSSSGDYNHNYLYDDVLYCHIIDPRTGYPINMPADGVQTGIAALTVLGENAMFNDAMSTALCVMGGREAIAYINQNLRSHDVIMTLYVADSDTYEVVANMQPSDYIITDAAALVCASALDAQGNIVFTGLLLPPDPTGSSTTP